MAERDGVIGLVAGGGGFPEVIAHAVKSTGRPLVCVQVAGEPRTLPAIADHYHRCRPGAVGEMLGALRAQSVREVVLAGRFQRTDLLGEGDALREAMMNPRGDHRDVSMFQRVVALLADLGMELVDQTRFVGDMLAAPGLLTARAPTAEEEADLLFGRTVARRLADLDVGQTVVVRRGVILAVEAAEGTDETIRRGGAMVPGTVVVKTSRDKQDPRFDIPAVGPDTVAAMQEVGARVLGIDARRTLLLHQGRLVADADAAGIAVVAIDAPPLDRPLHAES